MCPGDSFDLFVWMPASLLAKRVSVSEDATIADLLRLVGLFGRAFVETENGIGAERHELARVMAGPRRRLRIVAFTPVQVESRR